MYRASSMYLEGTGGLIIFNKKIISWKEKSTFQFVLSFNKLFSKIAKLCNTATRNGKKNAP